MPTTLPEQNVKSVIDALNWKKLTNSNLQLGILCCIAKESGFVPKNEFSYKNTANDRLRLIFGSRLAKFDEPALTALKVDDVKFYDVIYGGRYGNNLPGDGYKYRGRGFNQITFKDLYKKYGDMIGVDLVASPDKLNEVGHASKTCACYFDTTLKKDAGILKSRYNVSSLDAITDARLAVQIAVNANAGWGKDTRNGSQEKAAYNYFDQLQTLHKKLTSSPAQH
jgi:predicted chitinase